MTTGSCKGTLYHIGRISNFLSSISCILIYVRDYISIVSVLKYPSFRDKPKITDDISDQHRFPWFSPGPGVTTFAPGPVRAVSVICQWPQTAFLCSTRYDITEQLILWQVRESNCDCHFPLPCSICSSTSKRLGAEDDLHCWRCGWSRYVSYRFLEPSL